MLDLSQKTPLARSLNQLAERRAHDQLQQTGRNLPASVVSVAGSIATVKFELQGTTLSNVTCPIVGSEYIRLPVQPGMKGMVVSADAYLGGVTGLGGGTAALSLPANLSALAFLPLGNSGFSASEDPNKIVLYGPDGAIIRTEDESVSIKVDPTLGVVITAGAFTWIFRPDGNVSVPGNVWIEGSIQGRAGALYAGNLRTSGGVVAGVGTADTVTLQTHTHPNNNTPPTPGT